MKKMISGCIGIAFMAMSCTSRDTVVKKDKLLGYDYRLFQGTPAWNLAKAVEDEDTTEIINIIAKNKSLLESREPKFGQTLLLMGVKTLKFESVKTLVSLGADPNSQDNYDNSSPLMEAAAIDLVSVDKYGGDARYLKLLLAHGGDPNAEEKGIRHKGNNTRYTPLLKACSIGRGNLEYVKILVNAGARVNYNNEYDMTPLGSAAMFARNPDIVIYLLGKGADFRRPIIKTITGENLYITNFMRDWLFDLKSNEYKKKMQIADFLKKNGMDYWKTKIPDRYFEDYPKEYLEKY